MLQTAATYFATPIYKCQVYFCVIKFRKKKQHLRMKTCLLVERKKKKTQQNNNSNINNKGNNQVVFPKQENIYSFIPRYR